MTKVQVLWQLVPAVSNATLLMELATSAKEVRSLHKLAIPMFAQEDTLQLAIGPSLATEDNPARANYCLSYSVVVAKVQPPSKKFQAFVLLLDAYLHYNYLEAPS